MYVFIALEYINKIIKILKETKFGFLIT